MKLSKLTNPKVRDILQSLLSSNIPVATAWKLKKTVLKFNNAIKDYEDQRTELVKKHGIKDENGNLVEDDKGFVNVDPTKMDDFRKDLNELLDIDVADIPQIKVSELGNKLEIKTGDLFDLDELLTD